MPSWGFGGYKTYTNAPEISDQAGPGVQTGGSVSFGPSVGGDYVMLINPNTGETYHGGTITAGIGWDIIPVELHGDASYSWVWDINLYDVGIAIIDVICPDN